MNETISMNEIKVGTKLVFKIKLNLFGLILFHKILTLCSILIIYQLLIKFVSIIYMKK